MKRSLITLAFMSMAMLAPSLGCEDVFADPRSKSEPGKGKSISCQIICDGVGGDYRNFDEASSVASAQADCEEIVRVDPGQYAGECSEGATPTGCSCYEEK